MKKSILLLTLAAGVSMEFAIAKKIDPTREYLFTSESVCAGHPDKMCDKISDAILDAHLTQDPNARVACETAVKDNNVLVFGEITSQAIVDEEAVTRETIKEIGYTDLAHGMDYKTCTFNNLLGKQSSEISQGVDEDKDHEQGAGDQGLMFGYASNETTELMPLPISLAHKLTRKLTTARESNKLPWLRPDGKSQVTVKYVDGKPVEVTSVVIAAQHNTNVKHKTLKQEIIEHVIKPICKDYITDKTKYHVNETGLFIIGGPKGDAGLTGRKIIVDTYGGMGRHGGGAFSGKDPSKVDRSAAYMARYVAKNIVAAKLADRCEVQLAYAIGVAKPVSIHINTFGTVKIVTEKTLEDAVENVFPLKPADIIKHLNLKTPIYSATASDGHFGRSQFSWEKTDMSEKLYSTVTDLAKLRGLSIGKPNSLEI